MTNVKLIKEGCIDPINQLTNAFSQCYDKKISNKEKLEYVKRCIASGHKSPLRQVQITFSIKGISRACSAQFNRHCVGVNRTELSQRYTDVREQEVILPRKIKQIEKTSKLFEEHIKKTKELYSRLVDDFGIPKEDARYILPMGITTSQQVTFNLESLQNFLAVRMCFCSQWEINDLATKMFLEMKKHYPEITELLLGRKCFKNNLGYCNESLAKYNKCSAKSTTKHKSQI